MARNALVPVMAVAIVNGIFSPFVLVVFLLHPVWFPAWAPAYAQLVYMLSALILSTLTIMLAGVLRAGFAPTIYAARQAVNHGHIAVNGRKATIPSMRLKPGDVISIRERSRKSPLFSDVEVERDPVPYLAA